MTQYNKQTAQKLGAHIRELRKARGITGVELGVLVGLSQSKISKLEQGLRPLITSEMLARILNALQADPIQKQQAELLAAQADIPSAAVETYDFNYVMGHHLELQQNMHELWDFTANLIPLLLQTTEYRTAQLKKMGLDDQALSDNMRETTKRQDLLWNLEQKYYIIFLENTLYTLPSTVSVQLAQLDRLERILNLANCTIGIVPLEAGSSLFPIPACMIYDKNIMVYEVGSRDLIVKDQAEITLALKAFKQLLGLAHTGDSAKALIHKAAAYFNS